MQAIKDTREAVFIQKKISSVYTKLSVIEETLLQMIHFQDTFFPLSRLLAIEDLARDMGKEMNTFW